MTEIVGFPSKIPKYCGYQWYNPNTYTPAQKKTDKFLRFLLCNKVEIYDLYQALFVCRNLRSLGLNYCVRYNSVLKNGNLEYYPGVPSGDYPDSKVYTTQRLFNFYIQSLKMKKDKAYRTEIFTTKQITLYNQFANEYETIELDDLDIEVLSLLMQEKEISDFYSDNKFVSHQISVGRYWCRTYLFYDLAGNLLPTLTYSGFAFREFGFAFGSDVRNSNTKKGAACLLEKC